MFVQCIDSCCKLTQESVVQNGCGQFVEITGKVIIYSMYVFSRAVERRFTENISHNVYNISHDLFRQYLTWSVPSIYHMICSVNISHDLFRQYITWFVLLIYHMKCYANTSSEMFCQCKDNFMPLRMITFDIGQGWWDLVESFLAHISLSRYHMVSLPAAYYPMYYVTN